MLIPLERADILKTFVGEAMAYYENNNKTLPEQIIIYRDGMGSSSMTQKVQDIEVKVITELLENTTPGYKPKIIYCLIDKNNHQRRLFCKQNGEFLYPGRGTVVDTGLIENQGDNLYDFYLINHKLTVVEGIPVLYRVVYNTTNITKDQFEESTYHLCFNYFNFIGPIKVPMVCKYAQKICIYAN